jgi:O-antigen ligase
MLMKKNLIQLQRYFLPTSYTIFVLGFFVFPSSKFLSNFFYLAVAFPFAVFILTKKVDLRSLFSSRTFLLLTIYLVYMFCTLFWADSLAAADFSKYGRRVIYVLIFIAVTIHLTHFYVSFTKRLIILLCWISSIVAIVTIVLYYKKYPFPGTRLLGYNLLYNPFKASSLYGIVAISCIYLILQKRALKLQLMYVGLLIISLSYMLLAQSRGALLSFVVSLFVWQLTTWLFQKENYYIHRTKLLLVLVSISVVVSAVFIVNPEYFKLSFLGRLSTVHRLEMWEQLLVRIKDAPWFGHGLTADARTTTSDGFSYIHPHSVYVGTLLYGGIVGLALLVSTVVSALWQGFGRIRQPLNSVAACMVLYGAVCIGPNENMLIHHAKPFWLFFWFPIALVVASELPGHPLHGEASIVKDRDATDAAAGPGHVAPEPD